MAPEKPEEGVWVQVWAQVVDSDPHPDEVTVRLESHGEHYNGLVRVDRVTVPDELPGFVERCPSLYRTKYSGGADERFVRCKSWHDHPGDHASGKWEWHEQASYGYVEER